jgi:S-adenosylmethionine decarboxylase proenzyme
MFRARYGPLTREDKEVVSVLYGSCDAAGAHVRSACSYDFFPTGVSTVVILAESHASVHTWPDQGYAMVDYFSCGKDPRIDEFTAFWESKGFELEDLQVLDR